MKKFLVIIIAVIGFTANATSQNRYTVVVTTQLNYSLIDDKGNEVSAYTTKGTSQTIENICASNPEEAKNKAKDECWNLCRRDSRKNEGTTTFNGIKVTKYSTREVYDAAVTLTVTNGCQ